MEHQVTEVDTQVILCCQNIYQFEKKALQPRNRNAQLAYTDGPAKKAKTIHSKANSNKAFPMVNNKKGERERCVIKVGMGRQVPST